MKQIKLIVFLSLLPSIIGAFPAYPDPGEAGPLSFGVETAEKSAPAPVSGTLSKGYSKMIEDATDAIRQNPGEAILYLARGWAFYELKKTDKQIADATMAIKLKTKNGKAFFLRADGYLRQGLYQEALADLTQAISLGEGEAEVLQHRALGFYYLGRFENSVELTSKILSMDPAASTPRIDRGLASLCLGNYSSTLEDIRLVIEGEKDAALTREFKGFPSQLGGSEAEREKTKKELLGFISKLRNLKNPPPGLHYGQCRSLAI